VQIRRSDGALVSASVSPYPTILEKFCAASEWEPALRLCRYVKSQQLWACLAAMAVAGKELHTAEVAYAAIDQVDKLLYMCHIKELPTVEAREAELLLFRRRQVRRCSVSMLFLRDADSWTNAGGSCASSGPRWMGVSSNKAPHTRLPVGESI